MMRDSRNRDPYSSTGPLTKLSGKASDLAPPPALDPIAIIESVGEVVYAWDLASDALTWGENAARVLNISDVNEIATGRAFARFLASDNEVTRFDAVMQSAERDEGAGVPFETRYAVQPPGTDAKLWLEDVGRWFAGPDGRPARAQGIVRVINARHEHEQRLAYLSEFDELTGEMNRFKLTQVLHSTIEEAVRFRASCGFLLLAIDNLARVNEAYGFDIADEVIGAVARRLRAKLRGGDCLGRFSGNKFGVILRNCSLDDLTTAADRLLWGVRDDPIQTAAGPIAVTVSIGGIVMPRHARTVHEVLARAQQTLDAGKAKRPDSFLAYRPNIEREALRRDNIRATDEIVTALNDRRILLAFEPIVDINTRVPAIHECLMRIRGGDGSQISASDVVPVAERLGLIRMLDHRVLELVMAELIAAPGITLAINTSPSSTVDADWWSTLVAHLRAHPGVAERLIVEITETAALDNLDEARSFVARVKDLGCRLAIDDFGAGYTSFRTLRKLGIDILKIDGAFVENLTRSEDDRAFVRTMLDLAKTLGLTTIGEWVQSEESAAMLKEWGCDYLQGALVGLAKPERPWAKVKAVDAA
jgi:diguanylate cyclase (GGDEF)-like protein